jgi:5,10-methylenetetrahydrofolate reductase
VCDLGSFERFLKRVAHARLPIVAGVFPFESARNAEFMANEVPGVTVPEPLLERMRRNDAAAEGIAIAREIATGMRGAIQGLHISTQSGDIEAALAVLDGLR